MAEPAPRTASLATTYGEARVLTWPAHGAPRADLLLQHGANGKLDSPDLVRLVAELPGRGVTTRLLQQPFAVAGKRIGPRPAALDTVLDEVVAVLRPDLDGPLVLGGRSAGARCACRRAAGLGAVGVLALAFPLHPPRRPGRSRAEELVGCGLPALVVQGTRDPFGGPSELPALPAHVSVESVPHADHGFAVRRRDPVSAQGALDVLAGHVVDWLEDLLDTA